MNPYEVKSDMIQLDKILFVLENNAIANRLDIRRGLIQRVRSNVKTVIDSKEWNDFYITVATIAIHETVRLLLKPDDNSPREMEHI